MLIDSSMVISGFVSKIINEIVDIPLNPIKNAIKNADKKRKDKNQSKETRIYQVTIDALNEFTKDKYKEQDVLYDAAESIIKGLKNTQNSNSEAVRAGLKMLVTQVTVDTCEDFLGTLCYEICKEENRDLAIEVIILQQEQTNGYVQEGFRRSYLNEEEINRKLDYLIKELGNKKVYEERSNSENPVENRAEEYAEKWNKNVFLNNFNEEDENAGVNIKLKDIYIDECLPHYIWKTNRQPSQNTLRDLLEKYIIDIKDRKMLLILGQPGIGKSTLITWIMANLVEKKDDIFVYQFASDLENVNWQGDDILNDIFKALDLRNDDLQSKVLILDGFDEIHASKDRKSILNQLYQKLLGKIKLKNFSLVVTCREKYIYELPKIECDYITLQSWDDMQIKSFCRTYGEVSKSNISQDKIDKILENKKIFGIPLILYMVLALGISIEKNSSIVDVYDQMFSVDGGSIYDRCVKNSRYESLPHRIGEAKIKQQIHLISQRIAFWIFENKPEEAFISKDKYEEICDDIIEETSEENEDIKRDVLISNYFEPIKHCEGIGTDELQFVHRSIYEYFVAEYFLESIHNLTSKKDITGKLGELLKEGHLTEQILEFIKYKFDNINRYNLAEATREVFQGMLHDGMSYNMKEKACKNVLDLEVNIFANMLKVVHIWNPKLGLLDEKMVCYLRFTNMFGVDLRGIILTNAYLRGVNLSGADFGGADLRGADLRGANLRGANLREANLREANLRGADLQRANLWRVNLWEANLREANLQEANLNEADLTRANLRGVDLMRASLIRALLNEANLNKADLMRADLCKADITATIFDEMQVDLLCKKYDLNNSKVCIWSGEIIRYKEYLLRKQK